MENMERRFKILYVDEHQVIDLLFGITNNNFDFLQIPIWKNMPKGFTVVSVNYCMDRRAFAIGIYHKTFPMIKTGEMVEAISEVEVELKCINFRGVKQWAKEKNIKLF